MDKEDYFSDDCIVEDPLFLAIKSLIFCPLCKKIFKEPMMCSICQQVFCKKCIEDDLNKKTCPNKCINCNFYRSISKNEIISKIKYKCKNCNEEVCNDSIKTHLESNCKKDCKRTKTLGELYTNKKTLEKLSKEEMKKIDKAIINHFTSK